MLCRLVSASALALGFGEWHFDAAQCIPHAVAFDGAPDAVELMAGRITKLLHGGDTRGA
jgi:hypothetical protein